MKKIIGLMLLLVSISSFASIYTFNGTRRGFNEDRLLNHQLREAAEKYEKPEVKK